MAAKNKEDFNGLKVIGEICGAIRDELVLVRNLELPQKNSMKLRERYLKKQELNLPQKENTIFLDIRALV